ncbi:hypothetical protein [Streptomyces pseudogriseolus]|uniref:hypothetical protein n=1 Tax=Streptomyces pseudogriseolus TaxID=36817 RepID=UPI003FA33530
MTSLLLDKANPSPRQFAEPLAICLETPFDGLYETLLEQLGEDPDIFHIPGDESGPSASGSPGCGPYANCRAQEGRERRAGDGSQSLAWGW